MPIREYCIICETKGSEIFSKPYNDSQLINFFYDYYDKTKDLDKLLSNISKDFFSILKCKNCKFAWQKFYLEEKDQEILYDRIINQSSSFKKSLYLEKKDKNYQLRELNFFQNFFKEKSNLKILDYGAGWGGWLKNIKALYKNVYALEFSKNKIEVLKKNEINVLKIDKLIKENFTFDFIRLEQVLEHIDDLKLTLNLLNKITNIDSIVYISVPNSKKLFKDNFAKNVIMKGPTQPLEHLNSFTSYSLNKLFLKYNFKKVSIVSILLSFLKSKNYGYLNFKYLLKLVYNSFFSTRLLFRKIANNS